MDKDKEVVVKVEDYLPLYGLLLADKYGISVDGKNNISVAELFQYPEIELNKIHIESLNHFDRMSFQTFIKNKKNEQEVLKFVRELFDEFKTNGGNPLEWIYSTLSDLELNSYNYPALLRGVIQTKLMEWADYYEKIKAPVKKLPAKTFPDYILHPQKKRIAEALKDTFTGEKGKTIRLMIEVLKNQPQPLITYDNRQRQKIFDAMKLFFNWDIGSKQSIFDYKRFNDETDYKAIEVKVLYILKSIKINR
ncbi:MAG: hypothetical protein FD170_1966 [Bacteroidetes bacterium]|nr:MAG: hypothetical protein FD170_1966 [Bacteroidota bacterium]